MSQLRENTVKLSQIATFTKNYLGKPLNNVQCKSLGIKIRKRIILFRNKIRNDFNKFHRYLNNSWKPILWVQLLSHRLPKIRSMQAMRLSLLLFADNIIIFTRKCVIIEYFSVLYTINLTHKFTLHIYALMLIF